MPSFAASFAGFALRTTGYYRRPRLKSNLMKNSAKNMKLAAVISPARPTVRAPAHFISTPMTCQAARPRA
jgi:hypothetical protein